MLQEIHNADKVVKIGEYLIKVDLHNETVAVLPVSFQEQYSDLASSNPDNENIMWFSTEDEVLTLLEHGSRGTVNAKLKSCDSPKEDNVAPHIYRNNKRRTKARVAYQKVGIYFSLLVKGKTQRKRFGMWFRHYDGWVFFDYIYDYGVRCDNGGDFNYTPTRVTSSQGKASVRIYEDPFRALEWFFVRSAFTSSNGNRSLEIRSPNF